VRRRQIIGAQTITDGTSSQTTRASPRPRPSAAVSTIATSHSTMSAGASDGALASTATAITDPMPAAVHERCAATAVHSSQEAGGVR
jgi:hypothetical protein